MFDIQTHMVCRFIKFYLSSQSNRLEFQDFDGQARAEKISRSIITVFGFVGLVFGAVIQQFSQTIYILAAGFALALIITIPPYPLYRKKPLNWQKSRAAAGVVEGDSSKKTKQK